MDLVSDAVPGAVARGDEEALDVLERRLSMGGLAVPNTLSPLWNGAPSVPRNEVQVREMYAHKMPEYGYRIAASQERFPDWCLQDIETGKFVLAEVEHRSSSFLTHDHEIGGCEMVVCWEHDAPMPYMDVLELFSGTFHHATVRNAVEPHLKGRAFGAYAGQRHGRQDRAKSESESSSRSATGASGKYERAMHRAHRVLASIDMGMEYGETKTEAVKRAAKAHSLGVSTVWAILKKRAEYGL